ncbi:MAG: hypothetical protein AAFR73_13085 [Pseudomonadota bacterium]
MRGKWARQKHGENDAHGAKHAPVSTLEPEGSNALYQFSPDCALLARADLRDYGRDLEGIAIRPGSDQLFMTFDCGAEIITFDDTSTLPSRSAPLPTGADCMLFWDQCS